MEKKNHKKNIFSFEVLGVCHGFNFIAEPVSFWLFGVNSNTNVKAKIRKIQGFHVSSVS